MKTTSIEKEIEKYLKEVNSYIFCDKKTRIRLVEEIENSIYDYAEINGVKDMSEIYERFGTPEEVAQTYLTQASPKRIKNAINIRKVVFYGVVAALLIFVVYMIFCFINAYDVLNGYIEISPVDGETVTELV